MRGAAVLSVVGHRTVVRAPYHSRAFAKVLLHKLRADHSGERGLGVVGRRFRQHGFAGAWRPVHEHLVGRGGATGS